MTISLSRLVATLLLCLCAISASAAGLAPISQIFVFGDSLSDTGNAFDLTGGVYPPSPTYFDGRLSNGLLWVEPLSSDLGVTITNYAVAGAQTGTGNVNADEYSELEGTGLQTQVGQYVSDLGGGTADPQGMYVVFAGSNNFCADCFIPGVDDPEEFVTEGVTDILTAVGALLMQGISSDRLVVFSLPELGVTPLANAIPGVGPLLSQLVAGWNTALFAGLSQIAPDAVTIDVASLLQDVVADPGAFGLTNVTEACLAVGCNTQTLDPALDPDGFLFWDSIHPTRATHALLADVILEPVVIPLPAAIWLFVSALGLLGWLKRVAA